MLEQQNSPSAGPALHPAAEHHAPHPVEGTTTPHYLDGVVNRLSNFAEEASTLQRYGVAVIIVLIAAGAAIALAAGDVEVGRLSLPVLAILIATFLGGFRAGLLATALTIMLVEPFVLDPRANLSIEREEVAGLLIFALAALVGGSLSEALRHSRRRALDLAEQRQQLLRAVLQNEQQLRSLADAMPVLIARATPAGDLDYFNRTLLDYTGKRAEELEGDGWSAIIHPDDLQDALAGWQRRLAGGERWVIEQRLRRRDGVYRWHLTFGQPVNDGAGAIQYWIVANVDIHDRKVADQALAASEDRYRMLADTMEAMICTSWREDGAFDFFNRRFFEYTGLDPRAMPAVPMREILHPDDFAGAMRAYAEARARGHPFSSEQRFRRHDGEYRWHMVRGTPLPPRGDGSASGWMFTIVDTHDQKHIEEELRETARSLRAANAAKDEFLGLVSHELKTPITTILGNAEVLQRRGALLAPADRDSALGDIQHDAARLHQIIENLLILARLDRGKQIEMEPLLVGRLVQKIAEDRRARGPGRAIVVAGADERTPVLASDVYLEQVIRNLLSNATKYSPAGTPIEVRIWRAGPAMVIEVLDRGAGVPPEDREQIFRPFFRSATSRHVEGVGIGLAVCRRLIEAQGGEITYLPREEGGSRFRITLPIYRDEFTGA